MTEEDIVLTNLLKAKRSFEDALMRTRDDLGRDACIQRFEYCYELSWKTLKKVFLIKGLEDINSPKSVFREAAVQGLIEDPIIWFEFITLRNLTVHTYNEDTADKVFKKLNEFKIELNELVKKLQIYMK